MSLTFPVTPNVAAFLARWMAVDLLSAKRLGRRNLSCPGRRPSSAIRFTVRSENRRNSCTKNLRAITARSLNGRTCASLIWRAHTARTSAQAINYLENISATTNSAVLTEKLADLCDAKANRFPPSKIIQRALKLNPSPEQRIQIRLTLAEKFLAQDRDADAIDDYKNLLVESPDYPGKDSIAEKMTVLEQKSAGTNAPAKP